MGMEKRQYPRIALNTFARFYEETVDPTKQLNLQGIVKNYSNGGVMISTNYPLSSGSVITIELPIELATEKLTIIQVRGVVRWIQRSSGRRGEMGIEFFEFTREGNKSFTEWLVNLIE